MTGPLKLVLIYGSVRDGRFCDTVAGWATSQVERDPRFQLEIVDPAVDWPNLDQERFRRTLDDADAVLIVTPEYNHSLPGPLKVLIDSASSEWNGKPVAFVSYGGISGGLRAVEHLRGIFAELHAMTVRDTVSFPNAREAFGTGGKPLDEFRHTRSIRRLLSRLAWWARALKAAREAQAYGEAA